MTITISFKAKPIKIGGSFAVVIPKSYFNNGLIDKSITYEFEIKEAKEHE